MLLVSVTTPTICDGSGGLPHRQEDRPEHSHRRQGRAPACQRRRSAADVSGARPGDPRRVGACHRRHRRRQAVGRRSSAWPTAKTARRSATPIARISRSRISTRCRFRRRHLLNNDLYHHARHRRADHHGQHRPWLPAQVHLLRRDHRLRLPAQGPLAEEHRRRARGVRHQAQHPQFLLPRRHVHLEREVGGRALRHDRRARPRRSAGARTAASTPSARSGSKP